MKKEITVKLEGKEWTDLLDHVFEHKKNDVQVEGFRKGKVPKDVYIKKFGIESLYMDAVDHAIPNLYDKMLKENKDLTIACKPGLDVKSIDKDHLEVVFTITEKPEVKLGEYKNLGIKKEEVKVTDEEVEHELNHLKEQFVELKDKTEGKVEEGDEATIDYEGFKDGVAFEGGKGEDYPLVIGAKVTFKVKVKSLKSREYPEYDEEFFKDLDIPEVDSLDKLKEHIKSHIEGHKIADSEDKYFDECLTKVSENAKMEVPEEMIDEEIERIMNDFSHRLEMQGMNIDTYLKMLGMDNEKFKENFKEEAEKRVKFRLVIDEVIKIEEVKVSDSELNDYSKEMASKYQMEEKDFIEQIGGKDFLKYDLEVKKALEIITK